MTKEELATIQERIDYYFQNEDILLQAFTRKSYAMENGGCDNEILEFIGDKVLDLMLSTCQISMAVMLMMMRSTIPMTFCVSMMKEN